MDDSINAKPNAHRINSAFSVSRVSSDTRAIPEAKTGEFVEWLPVMGNPSYEVSNTGKVRNLKGRELALHLAPNGYLRVTLAGSTKKVHHLVAEAFIGPRPRDLTVNHIDGNKTNNHAMNLEYMTLAENRRHAMRMGLMACLQGERNHAAKLTEDQVRQIKRTPADVSNCELGRRFGVTDVAIRNIRVGKTWRSVA